MTPSLTAPRVILLTGASGFIGSHVRCLLAEAKSEVRLRVLSRNPVPPEVSSTAIESHIGDLRDSKSLAGVADGVDAVVHCASYVGRSAELATLTNVAGTRALLAEARSSGVRRLVYVSTAGVYGRGPFRNCGHGSLAVKATSALSSTRALGERLVMDYGGVVLRPNLVYGTGDKWVGPLAIRLAKLLEGRVNGFAALVSMVDVRRLAEATVRLALMPPGQIPGQLYDCNHPDPVVAAACLGGFMRLAGVPVSSEAIGYAKAYERLRALGEPSHDLDMLATDHWFDSADIWTDLRLPPGSPFHTAVSDHRSWYAAFA